MQNFREILERQKAYFKTDATKSYEWRMDQLNRLERLLKENTEAFYEALQKDFKTASSEYVFEVQAPLGTIEFTRSQLREWMKPIMSAPVPKFLAASGHTTKVIREPYGPTLVIGPFNGPLTLSLHPAIGVLSAGNPCVLKVSEQIPATSNLLIKLISQYFEPECVTAVWGAKDEVTEPLKLPFDFIFFTGSVNVGKIVARAAAENLTPVLLELGGQNPAFVDSTANISDAAKKIVWGAMAWGGQWCTSPGYTYVHRSVVREFVAECKRAVVELYGADPRSNPDYSKSINANAVKRLASLINPEKVVIGGKSDPELRYIDPTVLYPVTWSDRIMDGEIFGPLLPVMTYEDIDTAILEVKKRPKPLSAFLVSKDQGAIDHFLGSLSFGGGAINQVNIHLFVETMPFGGVGNSGVGNYYGKYGFDSMTHAKSILISPADIDIDHLLPPYTPEKVQALDQWFEY
jgi:aldehyde dehydrogenase (NAD+)